jgi:hypothetical protein
LHVRHVLHLPALLITGIWAALVPLLLLFGSLLQDEPAFFVRLSTPRVLRKGRTVASGVDGFAGSPAFRSGSGPLAQLAKRLNAISGTEYRIIACLVLVESINPGVQCFVRFS